MSRDELETSIWDNWVCGRKFVCLSISGVSNFVASRKTSPSQSDCACSVDLKPKYRTKIDLIGDRRKGLWSQRAEGWLYPMMLSAVSRRESHESQLSNRQFSIKKPKKISCFVKVFFCFVKNFAELNSRKKKKANETGWSSMRAILGSFSCPAGNFCDVHLDGPFLCSAEV